MAPNRPGLGIILLVAGLTLAATSLAFLGFLTLDADVEEIHEAHYEQAGSSYISAWWAPIFDGEDRLEYEFRFANGPGNVYVVMCDDLTRMQNGLEPAAPHFVERGVQAGGDTFTLADMAASPPVPNANQVHCSDHFLVLKWPTSQGQARPEVDALVRERPLATASALWPLAAAVVGLAVAVAGFLLHRRTPAAVDAPSSPEDSSVFIELAGRAEEWLGRLRRYLLVAGALGVFIWYPILLPWVWERGHAASRSPFLGVAFFVVAAALLVFLTWVWAIEYRRLGRELASWQGRLSNWRRTHEDSLADL